ncbi:MAG: Uncharacterized protein XU15_C0018G0051 [candidate division NC10 bacterium CSP1-5]|nr:MAG: Uncharacterized protein XU15_C0018G0051 [candidate division NC10 bacterium CSP1-5]
MRTSYRIFPLLAVVAVLQIACGSKPDSPEARVRALFDKAEVAAEKKDLGTFRDLISDQYLDEFRQDKQAILGILAFHLFRNQSIYLLTRMQTIAFPEPARAEAVILVATAGQPIRGTEELVALRADLFRFDITLADKAKGDWKVTRAQWRRVELKDFL